MAVCYPAACDGQYHSTATIVDSIGDLRHWLLLLQYLPPVDNAVAMDAGTSQNTERQAAEQQTTVAKHLLVNPWLVRRIKDVLTVFAVCINNTPLTDYRRQESFL